MTASRADETADHLVAAERLGDGGRVGVEVEQVAAACDRRGEVADIVEAEYAADDQYLWVTSTSPVPWERVSARR